MSGEHTNIVQACLDRLQMGDAAARDELVGAVVRRLHHLARHMLRSYPAVQRGEQVDDVVQTAALRLVQALRAVSPPTVRAFYSLATLQLRRVLLDLARQYQRRPLPGGLGRPATTSGSSDASAFAIDCPQSSCEPSRLCIWSEFHGHVDNLPADEKEVVELIWYQGLSQEEVAALTQVDVRTVRRRWQRARLKLAAVLPGSSES